MHLPVCSINLAINCCKIKERKRKEKRINAKKKKSKVNQKQKKANIKYKTE